MKENEPRELPHSEYCFGEFTLDLRAGFLRHRGDEVTLRPKTFEVLKFLVERHGQVVSKSALIDGVWPDAAITDNSLAQCVSEIRRALADDRQEVLRTVKGRGYVFSAAVKTPLLQMPRRLETSRASAGRSPAKPRKWLLMGALCLLVAVAGGQLLIRHTSSGSDTPKFTQITDFTDSAVGPVLSPDGKMIAFFRSDDWWLTTDPIYVKVLPHGEPVQIHDTRQKCCLAFSPDGSRLAYTALESGTAQWRTYTVSVLGGEPTLLLANAAGLTWLNAKGVLFSEVGTGLHMGIVTAREDRSLHRRIYFPKHERAMAHFSYASPDRRWASVIEMDPDWKPCRLIPLDGSSEGRQVGPQGPCTATAWSPDGKSMFFGAEVEGSQHLWRQPFPAGDPVQITFGPTAEEGIAIAPDGRSLITSIGTRQAAVWIHDAKSERALSSQGHVVSSVVHGIFPKFSSAGKSLFYLLRRSSPASESELWRADLESGKHERVLPGQSIFEYDISGDGNEVVFSTRPPGKSSQLWLARLDKRSSPRLITASGESLPYFSPGGRILFQFPEENRHYVGRMNKDGSDRSRVAGHPIAGIQTTSPDGRWIVAVMPLSDGSTAATMALPTSGGAPRRICENYCPVAWAPDGEYLYVGVERSSRSGPGKTLLIPMPGGGRLPRLPDSGIRGLEDGIELPGVRVIEAWDISPGPDPSIYAYVKTTVHRNLFRIPLVK